MGKKPLMENNLLKMQAEEVNAVKGDISAVKAKVDKMENKIDGQASAIAGFNNTVSKVSSEMKLAGNNNNINDSEVIKQNITRETLAEQHRADAESETKTLYRLIIVQLLCIIWYLIRKNEGMIEKLFKANEQDDEFKEGLIKKEGL